MAIKKRKSVSGPCPENEVTKEQAEVFANRLQDKQYGTPIRPRKEDFEVLSLRITRLQWEQVTDLSVERRKAKEKNHSKTEIIREAIDYYMKCLNRKK